MTATAQPVAVRAPAPMPPGASAQTGTATAPATTANPLQPSYWGGAPIGVAAQSGANVSPQEALKMIGASFLPAQRQQDAALKNMLAGMGIQGGGATSALQLQSGQQTAAEAPTLANAVQSAQGMTLQQALANAAAKNSMTDLNVQNAQQTGMFNASAANNASSQLAQMIQQGWQIPYEAMAGLYGQGLSSAGSLAGSEANNFAVPQQQSILTQLGL